MSLSRDYLIKCCSSTSIFSASLMFSFGLALPSCWRFDILNLKDWAAVLGCSSSSNPFLNLAARSEEWRAVLGLSFIYWIISSICLLFKVLGTLSRWTLGLGYCVRGDVGFLA